MPSRGVIEGGIGFRRNGKEKACEPCRKGKLACDHSVPVCNRCIRRKITSKCMYHPAPMTRTRESQASTSSPSGEPTLSLSSGNSIQKQSQRLYSYNIPGESGPNQSQDPLIPKESNSGAPTDTETGEQIEMSSPTYTWSHDAKFRRSARYYGPTSFSAVFTEGVELSADMDISEDPRKHPAQWYAKLTCYTPCLYGSVL